jgi:hypothetical protein
MDLDLDFDHESVLSSISELDEVTKEMNSKIQDIIDAYFLKTGKFVSISGDIVSKKDSKLNFKLNGGPKPETVCRLTIYSDLQKRIDQEIESYNRANLEPLNKRSTNHDEFYKYQIKNAEYHLQMAKDLFIDIKNYIGNKDDNIYIDVPFGNIKNILDGIKKSNMYNPYIYTWPDKIYLLGEALGGFGGNVLYQMIDIEFI